MDPGQFGFMADDFKEEFTDEEFEQMLEDEGLMFEELAMLGILGAAVEVEEEAEDEIDRCYVGFLTDDEIDSEIESLKSVGGYNKLKALWRDNSSFARHVYKRIQEVNEKE